MKIEIVTTPNEDLKETGFGTINACNSILDAIKNMDYDVRLNVCKTKEDLDAIVERNPNLVMLTVKYIPFEHEDDIWLADYFSHRGINFTGSSRDVLKFDSNKILAKSHLKKRELKLQNILWQFQGSTNVKMNYRLSFLCF